MHIKHIKLKFLLSAQYLLLYGYKYKTSLVAEWNRGRNYVIYKILIITDCPSMVLGLYLID
jgi:hypothetical protein